MIFCMLPPAYKNPVCLLALRNGRLDTRLFTSPHAMELLRYLREPSSSWLGGAQNAQFTQNWPFWALWWYSHYLLGAEPPLEQFHVIYSCNLLPCTIVNSYWMIVIALQGFSFVYKYNSECSLLNSHDCWFQLPAPGSSCCNIAEEFNKVCK